MTAGNCVDVAVFRSPVFTSERNQFRSARASHATGNCVDAAVFRSPVVTESRGARRISGFTATVLVGDTTLPPAARPVLALEPGTWADFLGRVCSGTALGA
jgi:hypothetical protein